MLHFTTAWLPEGAPDMEAARRWLERIEDSALLSPGSLGYAPHRLGVPFDMDVPKNEDLLDLLEEGTADHEEWFGRLADHLGPEGCAQYMGCARAVAVDILQDLATDDLHAEDLATVDLANGRLVTAALDPQDGRQRWFRRVESLRHTYHPDLASTADITFLRDRGRHARLVLGQSASQDLGC